MKHILHFGGGVNSTAIIAGCMEGRRAWPDYVLFADTGGELPDTYAHVEEIRKVCADKGVPFEIVTNADPENERRGHLTLEHECLDRKQLPSRVFGRGSCSDTWKVRPQRRWRVKTLGRGTEVCLWLGFDAGEPHRADRVVARKDETYVFPLIEWGWDRDDCIAAIERAGLRAPGKSSCFFCPARRKVEVLELAEQHPDLYERAVEMERNAQEGLLTVKGLGRHWAWEEIVKADRAQLRLFPETPEMECICEME